MSAYFASVNWGKRSVAIDLSRTEGQKLVHELVKETDVVLTSYRPSSDRKLGMDYDRLSEVNNRIIYVSMGNRTEKVVPTPTSDVTSICPPNVRM